MLGWLAGAIVVLGGIPFIAADCSGKPHHRLYSVGATKACLSDLPDAIVGLPPANPPLPPAPFVYSHPPGPYPPRVHGRLDIWYGHKGDGYEGMTLNFFKSERVARTSRKPLLWLYGGRLIRNVVVEWHGPAPRRSFQKTVLDCLRTETDAGQTSQLSAPKASLATFAGYWGGHTRGLRISPGGQATERVNWGCCTRAYDMSFEIRSVSGTLTDATATFRVTSYKRHEKEAPDLAGAHVGKLTLENGIVTNSLTEAFFCSNPAWGATMACGA